MTALVGVIAVIHLAVYVTTRNAIEEQFKLNAQGIAVSIAYNVMADIENYESFVKKYLDTKDAANSEYYEDEYYKKMQTFFASVKAYSNVKYIYSERRVDDKTIEFILDAEPAGHGEHSAPGEIGPNDPQREIAYTTGIPVGFNIARFEAWGDLIVAYAPIFDRDGKMQGITGVNIDAATLHSQMNRVQVALFAIYAVIIGMTLLVLTKYSDSILEPMLKDKLTGAYRKRYFEELIQEEITTSIREQRDLALMMLDLDHFKKVNDTYGHGFGDKVLASISETIKNILRQKDHFIRYGGEEFIALISGVNEKRALEVAERIRRTVEESEIFNEAKNISIRMTISIGIANLGGVLVSVQELIDRADKALYVAKEKRNCISTYCLQQSGRENGSAVPPLALYRADAQTTT
jgi:diguanylate cyclase (GGDEF)-like protein